MPTQEEVASVVIASRPVEQKGKEYSVAHTCQSEVGAYYNASPVSLSWSHSEREGADDGFRDTPRTVGDFIEGSILPPERTVIIAEECGELDRAIRKLPERLQRILMAKFWEGRKNAEIAGDEDISESRVTQLLHQAYCTLRPLLKNHAYAQASGF